MSHFTHIETKFQNLFYLEKALINLNIDHKKQEDANKNNMNLVIPQSNGYDIKFAWNGQEYELIVDLSFWKQSYSIESFIEKISKEYATEVIIGESKKIGFQPVSIKRTESTYGSNILILERWNS